MSDLVDRATLYVTDKGAVLRAVGRALAVEAPERPPRTLPAGRLHEIVIENGTTIDRKVMRLCAAEGIPIHVLDGRGRYAGSFVFPSGRHSHLRRTQAAAHLDDARATAIARIVVRNKIAAMRRLLADSKSDDRLDEIDLAAAADRDAVRGVEGAATRTYYAAWGRLLRADGFAWTGRTRRPPTDPVNGLLSLTYTMALTEVLTAVQISGLDPAFGFLHEHYPGRPGLALDLLEEWRPTLCDRFVLRALNRRELVAEHFTPNRPGDGVRLTPDGFRVFYPKWMTYLTKEERRGAGFVRPQTFRQAIQAQVRRFVNFLLGDAADFPAFVAE